MSRAPRHLFRGFRPPAAPTDLRRRALAASHAVPIEPAGAGHPARRSLTDRTWESLPLRLAWALLVLLLVGTNAYLDSTGPSSVPDRAGATWGRTTLPDARETVLCETVLRAMLDEIFPLVPDRAPGRSL